MINAQEWLDQKYPIEERKNVKEIFVLNEDYQNYYDVILFSSENFPNSFIKDENCLTYLGEGEKLVGSLDLNDFTNLESLVINYQGITQLKVDGCLKLKKILCPDNQITSVNLSGLGQLEEIDFSNNLLTDIDLSSLNPTKLTKLHVDNNNFSAHDLSYLSRFANLESLYIGNDNQQKINQGVYNRFYGSLGYLRNLEKLVELSISGTDIDSGLVFLPTKELSIFYCAEERVGAKVKKIRDILELSEEEARDYEGNVNWDKVDSIKDFQEEARYNYYKNWPRRKLREKLNKVKDRVNKDDLKSLLEAQREAVLFKWNSLTRGLADSSLQRAKQKLNGQLSQPEITEICQLQIWLTKTALEQSQANIEVSNYNWFNKWPVVLKKI